MNQNWEQFQTLINGPSFKAVIVTHTNPDADAIGSSLAWAAYLHKKSHSTTVIVPNDAPKYLQWMSNAEQVISFEKSSQLRTTARKAFKDATVVFCLDFNALNRIKEVGKLVAETKATKVLIDHHIAPEDFADIVFSDTTRAATAQYIFELIVQLGDKTLIDKQIAECLYAGMMTDTGSFRHNSTTAAVHQAVAELIQTGLEVNRVHRLLFDQNPVSRTRLLGYVLSEKMVVLPQFRTVYMTLSEAEFRRFESNMGDTDGIVNYGLQIEDIVMAVLIIERKDEIKLSFRSVEDFSVRDLASKYFNGGGHKNASGGQLKLTIDETVQKLLEILPEYENQLLNVQK
jgi:bifunctional oligoribonuclease and PAP phosphatase NrnA